MADHTLRDQIIKLLDENNDKSSHWLAVQIVAMADRRYRGQVQDNLMRLFFDGDFAAEHHSHVID